MTHTLKRQEITLRRSLNGHQEIWQIGAADRWDVDQEIGNIWWTFSDGVIASAPVQIVGTYNSLDSTFLWAWDHPSILEPLRKDAQAVLAFAKANDVEFLCDRMIECSEDTAWNLVALATLIADRQGAYRGPTGATATFMTFGEVKISKSE